MTTAEEAGTRRLRSVEEARDAALAASEPRPTVRIRVADALGRVLAETAISRVSLPPWDNSAMDGYAIVSADTAGASEDEPVRLAVHGDIRAGVAPDVVVRARVRRPDRDRCARPGRGRRGHPGRGHDATRRRRVAAVRAGATPPVRFRSRSLPTSQSSGAAPSGRPAATSMRGRRSSCRARRSGRRR